MQNFSYSSRRQPDDAWPTFGGGYQGVKGGDAGDFNIDTESDFGILSIKPAAQWVREAWMREDPVPLWLSLWHQGEICCLFADSNLGKSIYAVEIAESIARERDVLYCDFELSDKQFQLRYTGENGRLHEFSDHLFRCEINPDRLTDSDFEDLVIDAIENAAVCRGIEIIVVDNITFLCNESEKSDAAGHLMMRLMQLKKQLGLSILVLAHTPKRSMTSPITQNDLAGSKKLINFFDSCFAIGRSAQDEHLRYIKQIKCRAGAFEYGADNVIVCEIEKCGSWLHFNRIGYSTEREHLSGKSVTDAKDTKESIIELRGQGLSFDAISERLGISKTYAYKVCKKEMIS